MYYKKYGNSSTTHKKISNLDAEMVKKLDYYLPTEDTLFNLNTMDPKRENMKKVQNMFSMDIKFPLNHRLNSKLDNQCLYKFDNIAIENNLETEKNEILNKIKNLKTEHNKLVKDFKKLQETQNDMEMGIEAIKNYQPSKILLPSPSFKKRKTSKEEEEKLFTLNVIREVKYN
jgi:hypothetical protein